MTTTTATTPRSFSAGLRAARRRRSLISLTPLIDVVFILLLFFMLASSFLDLHSIVLDAPAEGSGAPAVEGALLVDVRLDGVRFAGQYVGMEELVQRVRIALADTPDRRVLVRPAERVKLQDTVRILDALSAAGVKQLSLMETAPSGGGR
ncbi:ExbD/TolR family protein [Salinisphaera shabanensis]|uniref:ExbD/TolR family protein n=1 Tax=Salinisphaera shabanensis TaxID=180542 RepID=UPI003340181B